jgi:uncharacterized protein (DUF362 family)/NAD-dependent dihydropyrimidine dehydrogenase PreA subunit
MDSPIISCTHVDNFETPIGQYLDVLLTRLGDWSRTISPGDRVLVKPNWVAPFPQATTKWDLVIAVVERLRALDTSPFLAESSGFEFNTEATFKALGLYERVAKHDLEIINLDQTDMVPIQTSIGIVEIARIALETDHIVNLAQLKYHSLSRITAAQKNLFGLVSRASRRRLHAKNLTRGILAVNDILTPQLHIVDAREFLTRAVYGKRKQQNLILASKDPLSLDCLGARLLGYAPTDIDYIAIGLQTSPDSAKYQIVGDLCEGLSEPIGSMPKRGYRTVFKYIYRLDDILARFFPKTSIIPSIHYWLGVRPHVLKTKCTACGICAQVCPVAAIKIQKTAYISPQQCMKLRCLRCVKACPQEAIEVSYPRRPH